MFTRRSFLALSAMLPWSFRAFAAGSIPVGLELYSVRNALKDDPTGTVRTVAQMGYQVVEFYAPYFDWTDAQTTASAAFPLTTAVRTSPRRISSGRAT